MILLNDDSIYVGQIKQLLNSFELPRCPVYDQSIPYIKGQHYIKDGAVWVVTDDKGTAKEISLYSFGDKVEGITGTFPVSSALYDSKTHAYLGNYLRFIRDFVGMDLMGLYNCNSYDMPSSLSASYVLESSNYTESIGFSTEDSNYSLIMVPVRWGKEYTIAVDWHGEFEMACIHYSNGAPSDNEMIQKSYHRELGPRFNHPFLYETPRCPGSGDTKESTLKLMLKVPYSCKSSIVVLEGDFRRCSMDNMYMAKNTNEGMKLGDALCWHAEGKGMDLVGIGDSHLVLEPVDEDLEIGDSKVQYEGEGRLRGDSKLIFNSGVWNFDYVTKSQLLSMNLGSKALLADRLVEYLSLQAISPMDDVVDNIKRLQKTLNAKYDGYSIKSYGKWDDSMRQTLYHYNWKSGLIHKKEDMLSYFDKDMESEMGGLTSKHKDAMNGPSTFAQGTIGGR